MPPHLRFGSCFALLLAAAVGLTHPATAADVTVTLDAGAGFVIEDNTATTERLRVDEATGNISRNGALFVHTTGTNNTFVGVGAGSTSTTGTGGNSAFGDSALYSNFTGSTNSAFGQDALRSNYNGSSNSAFGQDALRSNTSGSSNSAFGDDALRSNSAGGTGNNAFGHRALESMTNGVANSAFGASALRYNTTGFQNSAFGVGALRNSTTANFNSAFGQGALYYNTTGAHNQAFGEAALRYNTTGARNLAIGYDAGRSQTTGNDNIYIANSGVAAESGKIKIGASVHTETFIEGIDGNTASGGVAVLINSSNELHTLVSSLRFKEAVRDMGDASKFLMKLRPVSFRYRDGVANGEAIDEYGLIAEEVAEVAPELVARDAAGEPYSVRYHVLPSLLLNEMQKQRRTIGALLARVEQLEHRRATDRTETDQ